MNRGHEWAQDGAHSHGHLAPSRSLELRDQVGVGSSTRSPPAPHAATCTCLYPRAGLVQPQQATSSELPAALLLLVPTPLPSLPRIILGLLQMTVNL